MSDHAILIRMLDDSLHEFDRLMERALEEINMYSAIGFELESLVSRHVAARAAGSAFVVEAAMSLAEIRQARQAA